MARLWDLASTGRVSVDGGHSPRAAIAVTCFFTERRSAGASWRCLKPIGEDRNSAKIRLPCVSQRAQDGYALRNPKQATVCEPGRTRGAARIRTGDGGFAIHCLSHLATAPEFDPRRGHSDFIGFPDERIELFSPLWVRSDRRPQKRIQNRRLPVGGGFRMVMADSPPRKFPEGRGFGEAPNNRLGLRAGETPRRPRRFCPVDDGFRPPLPVASLSPHEEDAPRATQVRSTHASTAERPFRHVLPGRIRTQNRRKTDRNG